MIIAVHFFSILSIIVALAVMPLLASAEQQKPDPKYGAADQLYLERADFKKAEESLCLYREYFKNNPADAKCAWRLSMACYFAGFNIEKYREKRKALFGEGRDAGLASLKINNNSVEAHFWTAINMAHYGDSVGVVKMLFTLNSIYSHLEESIRINPSYAYGGAYRALGKIKETLPGVLGGSNSKAKAFYEKAIENAPDEPINYYFLAQLILTVYKDKPLALQIARKGLSFGTPEYFRYESFQGITLLRGFLVSNS
jgi:tetratricopeptide (TPR) repeat protein